MRVHNALFVTVCIVIASYPVLASEQKVFQDEKFYDATMWTTVRSRDTQSFQIIRYFQLTSPLSNTGN